MGPRSRGQSEIIGVVLLIGVMVTLVFGVGFIVVSDWQSQADDETRANIDSTTTADNVTLEHRGGDAFDTADVTLIVRNDAEQRHTLDTGTQERGTDASRFEPGDRWTIDHTVSGSTLRVIVVHEPSNAVLHAETTEIN